MSQLSLFASDEIPSWPAARCGNCVHRNARPDAPSGACSPVGRRGSQEAPCDYWFGLEQLIQATQPRKAA